jgi:hypothetical protein
MTTSEHQRKMHSRSGATPVVWRGCAPFSVAHDKAQNGAHVRFVGVSRCSPRGLTHSSPVRTGAGFGSRLFSHPIARAADPLAGAAHRRLDLLASRCRDADLIQIVAQLTGVRSRRFHLQQHVSCQGANALEGHRLSQSVGFNTDQPTERHLEPCSLNRGKRFPR